MTEQEDCYNFLSFPACVVSTGLRGTLIQLLKNEKFNTVLTTCGTLDHDIARAYGAYYHGNFMLDDAEVKERGYSRLGNVLVPASVYGDEVEKRVMQWLQEIYEEGKKELSTHELVWEFGKRMPKNTICWQAWKHKIPVFIPGITDGAIGTHLLMFSQDHPDFRVNVLKDEKKLSDIVFDHPVTGALMIGGGISKHHVIWWNQFKDGLDYAVYLTSAPEWDGSLSGARMREAISWGKLKAKARYVTVEGDATVNLPLVVSRIL